MGYYWYMDIDNLLVCMSNSQYIYGYEYPGVSPRLVITLFTVSHAFATCRKLLPSHLCTLLHRIAVTCV